VSNVLLLSQRNNWRPGKSPLGQTRTSEDVRATSAHPSITDIERTLREIRHGPNRRHSLGSSIGRFLYMSPLAWQTALTNPWNFMASGELRLQQMSKAGGNPQRFYLALGGSRSV
jgi:hypothetical protein